MNKCNFYFYWWNLKVLGGVRDCPLLDNFRVGSTHQHGPQNYTSTRTDCKNLELWRTAIAHIPVYLNSVAQPQNIIRSNLSG